MIDLVEQSTHGAPSCIGRNVHLAHEVHAQSLGDTDGGRVVDLGKGAHPVESQGAKGLVDRNRAPSLA